MPQIRKKAPILQVFALALVFALSFASGKFIADWGKAAKPAAQNDGSITSQPEEDLAVGGNRLNILLMGIDARKGEKDARSDSMILVSIDRNTKKMAMISIPRDTMVEIDGYGKEKINSANLLGGPDLARKYVEDLMDVEIPYYVKTNFNGFKEIVDTLGGVELNVEKRMYYPSEAINLKAGKQKLDGEKALAYVRFRHDALGDISRTERQQKFLTVLAGEMMKASTILKLPRLVPQLMNAVDTNLGLTEAVFLARVASGTDSGNIVTATLPGVFYNYKGISYWKVDESRTKLVLNEVLDGVKVATISGPDVNVPATKRSTAKVKPAAKDTSVPQENYSNSDTDNKKGQPDSSQSDVSDKEPAIQQMDSAQQKQGEDSGRLSPDAVSSSPEGVIGSEGSSTSNGSTSGNTRLNPNLGQTKVDEPTKALDAKGTPAVPKVEIITQG